MPATPETLNVVSIRIVNFSKTIFKYFSTFFNDHTNEFLSLQLDNGWVSARASRSEHILRVHENKTSVYIESIVRDVACRSSLYNTGRYVIYVSVSLYTPYVIQDGRNNCLTWMTINCRNARDSDTLSCNPRHWRSVLRSALCLSVRRSVCHVRAWMNVTSGYPSVAY